MSVTTWFASYRVRASRSWSCHFLKVIKRFSILVARNISQSATLAFVKPQESLSGNYINAHNKKSWSPLFG
jgi:hypothetical protein